jgi:hypothetical protein
MAQGSRLPCKEGVRVGVMHNAFTILSTGTGEPDDAKVSRPVRRGAGRKGGLADLARGLPYLVPRFGYRRRLKPGVRVCRDKPARCEGVQVSDSEGRANHTGPESCASFGHGVREALTGECAGRVESPEIGPLLGADALLTRGRQQRRHCDGQVSPPLAGSKTPGMHGNMGCGTRGGPAPGLGHRTQARTANL